MLWKKGIVLEKELYIRWEQCLANQGRLGRTAPRYSEEGLYDCLDVLFHHAQIVQPQAHKTANTLAL